VHYAGWFADGRPIRLGARKRNDPFEFTLGAAEVIAGWDQGLPGMKSAARAGSPSRPRLAYGEQGAGDTIPPNVTLIFEVKLLAGRDPRPR